MAASEPPSGRSYNQYCAVARGLDIIGERWTLLIVRDLLVGPKRYKDLLDGLPGIGSNLLANRLRDLERRGVVQRSVLPPPAGSTVYELTPLGEMLEPVVMAISRFGATFLGEPRENDVFPADAYVLAMRQAFWPDAAAGVRRTYELRVGGRAFEVRVEDGQCVITQGNAHKPDAVITAPGFTLNALLKKGLPPEEALAGGQVTVEGEEGALKRLIDMFSRDGTLTSGSGRIGDSVVARRPSSPRQSSSRRYRRVAKP